MISRTGSSNFFVAHYDWIACGAGILALALGVAFYVLALGNDPDAAREEALATVDRMKPSKSGVPALEMDKMRAAVRMTRSPLQMADVSETAESFLASERRVMCKCQKAIPGDVRLCPKCPYCGEKQEEEQVIVLDADGDGMPDAWEKKYGLNPNDPSDAALDKDKDDFTNLEEYQAKTDPTDAKDHPDYLDSLKIQLPLQATYMPFLFTGANKIPSGWRCSFYLPDAKDNSGYGRKGLKTTALFGEEIAGTGFILRGYEKKEAKQEIKGAQGLKKTVDVSEVTVERKGDGKKIVLVLSPNLKAKPASVDVQATLVYERGSVQNLNVVSGAEIKLSGTDYKVVSVAAAGKGAKVVIKDVRTGKTRTLEALE